MVADYHHLMLRLFRFALQKSSVECLLSRLCCKLLPTSKGISKVPKDDIIDAYLVRLAQF